jgi:hypothetical protein
MSTTTGSKSAVPERPAGNAPVSELHPFPTRTTHADYRQRPEGPELANLSTFRGTYQLERRQADDRGLVSRQGADRFADEARSSLPPWTRDRRSSDLGRRTNMEGGSANRQKPKDRNYAPEFRGWAVPRMARTYKWVDSPRLERHLETDVSSSQVTPS